MSSPFPEPRTIVLSQMNNLKKSKDEQAQLPSTAHKTRGTRSAGGRSVPDEESQASSIAFSAKTGDERDLHFLVSFKVVVLKRMHGQDFRFTSAKCNTPQHNTSRSMR